VKHALQRRLEHLELPGEHEARLRAFELVCTAWEQREPAPRPRRRLVPILAAAVLLAVLAAAFSAPGRAVLRSVREAIGVEQPAPALLSLPSRGRLLVVGGGGDAWVVHPDGGKRRLGDYTFAGWSPRGLYAAVARGRELTAVEPDGDVRWSLTTPDGVTWPRWAPSGFRIAYKSGGSLRVVIGNGRGDRLLARDVDDGTPALAWAPAVNVNLLAYADRAGRIHLVDVDTRRERWSSPPGGRTTELAWSPDGTRLLALGPRRLRIFEANGLLLRTLPLEAPAAVAFSRRADHTFALARRLDLSGSELVLLRAERGTGRPRRLFSGPGIFQDVVWSPNDRWILLTWPSADQWLFLRPGRATRQRLAAYSAITRQFGEPGGVFPTVGGWCCP